jgi:hypothetical protein
LPPEGVLLPLDPLDVAVRRERLLGDRFQSLDQRPAHLRGDVAETPLGGAGQNEPHSFVCQ